MIFRDMQRKKRKRHTTKDWVTGFLDFLGDAVDALKFWD